MLFYIMFHIKLHAPSRPQPLICEPHHDGMFDECALKARVARVLPRLGERLVDAKTAQKMLEDMGTDVQSHEGKLEQRQPVSSKIDMMCSSVRACHLCEHCAPHGVRPPQGFL